MGPGDRVESTVLWFLNQDPGRAIYLQDVHRPDERGLCAGCQSQTTWIKWPCIVRRLADESIARLIPLQRKAPG